MRSPSARRLEARGCSLDIRTHQCGLTLVVLLLIFSTTPNETVSSALARQELAAIREAGVEPAARHVLETTKNRS